MKKTIASQWVAGILLFASGVATGLLAQNSTDSPQRVEQKRTDLSGASGMEVIASISEYKVGDSLGLHSHHGVEMVYVMQGAKVQPPGKEPSLLPTGATLMNLRDVKHAGWTVVGDSSLKLFTVHVVDKGKPLYEFSN
ncbi:MAG TPA: cupin domain-containing protein [Burkholderiaceae bacterium]|nr:cupin domain-containing protein [Burkholderiaceae bacterium]